MKKILDTDMWSKVVFFIVFLGAFSILTAQNFPHTQRPPNLKVQNAILAKVNKETISVIDVMKKMDMHFHKAYPQLVENKIAKYQFYSAHWRHFLSEMIDMQLILADAKTKEIKVTNGEIREEIEKRFGPNVMSSLDKINLTFDEAWKLVKSEMVVQRMNWIFVHSKALQKLTPESLKIAYQKHCFEHPTSDLWEYRVLSIQPKQDEDVTPLIEEIHHTVTMNKDVEQLQDLCVSIQEKYQDQCSVQLSNTMKVLDQNLSEKYKTVLITLNPGNFSSAIYQKSKSTGISLYRIFFLEKHEKSEQPSFQSLEKQLEDGLLNEKIQEYTASYLKRLRKYYGYEHFSHQSVDETFEPFVIE